MSYTDKMLAVMDRLGLDRSAEVDLTSLTSFLAPPVAPAVEVVRELGTSSSPQQTLTRALAEDFAKSKQCVKVRIPGVPEPVWLVPNVEDVARLWATDGVSRGHVFTAKELADVASIPSRTSATWQAVALVKIVFGGDVLEVRRR